MHVWFSGSVWLLNVIILLFKLWFLNPKQSLDDLIVLSMPVELLMTVYLSRLEIRRLLPQRCLTRLWVSQESQISGTDLVAGNSCTFSLSVFLLKTWSKNNFLPYFSSLLTFSHLMRMLKAFREKLDCLCCRFIEPTMTALDWFKDNLLMLHMIQCSSYDTVLSTQSCVLDL